MKLLVIGSLNMDLVVNCDRRPVPGETVFGTDFNTVCGGKGSNQAVAAAKLGADVKMLGAVGNDVFGQALIDNLKANNIGAEGVEISDSSSGIAVITVSGGDNTIILNKGANATVTKDTIDRHIDLIKWADVVLMQFEIPLETVLYAAKTAKQLGKTVVINPAPICDIPNELLNYCDLLIPNEHEAAGILGYEVTDQNAEKAVIDLVKKGVKQALITLGSSGSIYSDGKHTCRQGIHKTKVVDTTAAGDSFAASFLIAQSEGKTVPDSMKFAATVSGIVVSRPGASTSIPTRQEVDSTILNRT